VFACIHAARALRMQHDEGVCALVDKPTRLLTGNTYMCREKLDKRLVRVSSVKFACGYTPLPRRMCPCCCSSRCRILPFPTHACGVAPLRSLRYLFAVGYGVMYRYGSPSLTATVVSGFVRRTISAIDDGINTTPGFLTDWTLWPRLRSPRRSGPFRTP